MNKGITYGLIFLLGAAAGSVATWKLVKTKYEQIAQEEIDSVKEVFAKKHNAEQEKESESPVNFTYPKTNLEKYENVVKESGYLGRENDEEGGSEPMENKAPFVIPPEEFGENDYETVSLTYYADGVLTDEYGDIIENVDHIVGVDSLNHFGEYEDDSVFVRNNELELDYEILMDYRNYSDVSTIGLDQTDDE